MHLMKLGLFAVCWALCACKKSPEPGEAQKGPRETESASLLPPRDPSLPLAQRLAREREAPVRDAVTAGLTALSADQNRFVRTQQVLAEPLGAEYCELGVSEAGVVAALCGFSDAAAARSGAKRSRAVFASLIPQRELLVRERLLLTLSGPLTEQTRAGRELLRRRFEQRGPMAQRAP